MSIEVYIKLQSFKRLRIGDFTDEQQALVEKLSVSLNIGIENLYIACSNNLTFADNFSGTQKTFPVSVDASGVPKSTISFPLNTTSNAAVKILGTEIINAINTSTSTNYPSATPFASFTQNGNNITINHIAGLQANDTWSITILVSH